MLKRGSILARWLSGSLSATFTPVMRRHGNPTKTTIIVMGDFLADAFGTCSGPVGALGEDLAVRTMTGGRLMGCLVASREAAACGS